MNIIVLQKQVPDLVEELVVHENGKELDASWLKFILNEYDDHALEQALLIKEQQQAHVHVLALDAGEVDEALFNAVAKGVDAVSKIHVDGDAPLTCHAAARLYADAIRTMPFDLIFTGVQAIDDLDGQVGALLAVELQCPYLGVVRGVDIDPSARAAIVKKEYPGSILAEMTVKMPAVIGIQAAEHPPRYVPVAKLRQAMKTAQIEEINVPASPTALDGALELVKMYKPESSEHAIMIDGSMDVIAAKIKSILSEHGIAR